MNIIYIIYTISWFMVFWGRYTTVRKTWWNIHFQVCGLLYSYSNLSCQLFMKPAAFQNHNQYSSIKRKSTLHKVHILDKWMCTISLILHMIKYQTHKLFFNLNIGNSMYNTLYKHPTACYIVNSKWYIFTFECFTTILNGIPRFHDCEFQYSEIKASGNWNGSIILISLDDFISDWVFSQRHLVLI
jgi:hypothetical protein